MKMIKNFLFFLARREIYAFLVFSSRVLIEAKYYITMFSKAMTQIAIEKTIKFALRRTISDYRRYNTYSAQS